MPSVTYQAFASSSGLGRRSRPASGWKYRWNADGKRHRNTRRRIARGNVLGRGTPGYVFGQMISEVVSDSFGGMRVPGTRGSNDNRYSNVIIFRPHPNWPAWVEPGS